MSKIKSKEKLMTKKSYKKCIKNQIKALLQWNSFQLLSNFH